MCKRHTAVTNALEYLAGAHVSKMGGDYKQMQISLSN